MINGVFELLDSWWKVYYDPSFECCGFGGGGAESGLCGVSPSNNHKNAHIINPQFKSIANNINPPTKIHVVFSVRNK